jgi:hypothetical protein
MRAAGQGRARMLDLFPARALTPGARTISMRNAGETMMNLDEKICVDMIVVSHGWRMH